MCLEADWKGTLVHMKISTKGTYALEAMVELAISRSDDYISIHKIADKRKCSIKYLEQIFQLLKSNHLVISSRGKDGGYKLAKAANQITVKDIILAVEVYLDPVACLSNTCSREKICKTRPIWQGMQNEIFSVLESKSLEVLANAYAKEALL